jgi:hypothetical protein
VVVENKESKVGFQENISRIGSIHTLNAKLNPICHLLALLGSHHILYVSRIEVKAEHHYSGVYKVHLRIRLRTTEKFLFYFLEYQGLC